MATVAACSPPSRAARGFRRGRLGAALLAALLSGCGATEPSALEPRPADPVEVGVAVPSMGGLMLEARRAWQLVIDPINASGGIDGRPLDVVERRALLADENDLRPVADAFIHLTNEGYEYIISLVSGAALQPIVDVARPNGVLAMSITSEDAAADLPEFDGLLLRAILPTDRLLQKQALALQERGLRSIAIVGDTTAGRVNAHQAAMHDAYVACAACSVADVTYPAEADLYRYDWESLGAAAMQRSPDVVFLASANLSALLDTIFWIERAGYTGLYYFAHGAYMASARRSMLGSRVPERFRSYDLALPPNERLDRFLAAYEARYGDSVVPEPRLIAFADYLALLALAMARVGPDDPRAVAQAMKELAGPPGERFGTLEYPDAVAAVRAGRDIDVIGLSGPLDFDAHGEVSDGFMREYALSGSGDVTALP